MLKRNKGCIETLKGLLSSFFCVKSKENKNCIAAKNETREPSPGLKNTLAK